MDEGICHRGGSVPVVSIFGSCSCYMGCCKHSWEVVSWLDFVMIQSAALRGLPVVGMPQVMRAAWRVYLVRMLYPRVWTRCPLRFSPWRKGLVEIKARDARTEEGTCKCAEGRSHGVCRCDMLPLHYHALHLPKCRELATSLTDGNGRRHFSWDACRLLDRWLCSRSRSRP